MHKDSFAFHPNLKSQFATSVCELLWLELKHKSFGETIYVADNLLVETLHRDAVKLCQVTVKQNLNTTQRYYAPLNVIWRKTTVCKNQFISSFIHIYALVIILAISACHIRGVPLLPCGLSREVRG